MHLFQSKSHTFDELLNLAWLEDGFFFVDAIVELAIC